MPAGTASIALSQGDGWGYTWSDKTCTTLGQKVKPADFWDHVKSGVLAGGLSKEGAKCSLVPEGRGECGSRLDEEGDGGLVMRSESIWGPDVVSLAMFGVA